MIQSKQTFSKKLLSIHAEWGHKTDHKHYRWKIRVPEKIQIFIWLSFHGKIQTKSMLARKGWKGSTNCTLCDGEIETNDHLFLEWSFSRQVWFLILADFHLPDLPSSIKLLRYEQRSRIQNLELQEEIDALLAIGLWCRVVKETENSLSFKLSLPNRFYA